MLIKGQQQCPNKFLPFLKQCRKIKEKDFFEQNSKIFIKNSNFLYNFEAFFEQVLELLM